MQILLATVRAEEVSNDVLPPEVRSGIRNPPQAENGLVIPGTQRFL